MKTEIIDIVNNEIFKQTTLINNVKMIEWDSLEEKFNHLDRETEYLLKMITFKQELLTFLKGKVDL